MMVQMNVICEKKKNLKKKKEKKIDFKDFVVSLCLVAVFA